MTGPEYIKIRKQFVEALAWVIAQNSNHNADDLINKAVSALAKEVKEEVDSLVSA